LSEQVLNYKFRRFVDERPAATGLAGLPAGR
jgi:hypothetical protein